MGAYSENDRIAFRFNPSLFLLSDKFSECILSPSVSYPPVHTVRSLGVRDEDPLRGK